MPGDDQQHELSGYVARGDVTIFDLDSLQQQQSRHESVEFQPCYEVRLKGEPISLTYVEFRILQLLVRRPYHAFSREQIVQAVATPESPVDDRSLDGHIASLRDKLGLFSDYVQTVPYVGYRFKL
jgi:two-component system phosphate regulon response regulator PhoB